MHWQLYRGLDMHHFLQVFGCADQRAALGPGPPRLAP